MTTYRTLAIVDDVNTCDCCGKSNLKSTVAMERDDGEVLYFGSVCATRHSGRESKVIRKEAVDALAVKKAAAHKEMYGSTEHANFQTRMEQARNAGVRPGNAFIEFCRDACAAAEAKQVEIAAKFGIPAYSF